MHNCNKSGSAKLLTTIKISDIDIQNACNRNDTSRISNEYFQIFIIKPYAKRLRKNKKHDGDNSTNK